MILLKEFHKITKQIWGKENMFGYETTTANQLYLLYCICGKMYFTDKIHTQMKYFWFALNLSGILVAYTIGLACFLYDTKQDVRMQLDIMNAVGISTDLGIFFPVIVYYYREGIEAMIDGIDEVLKAKSKISQKHESARDRINAKTMIVSNFSIVLAMDLIYTFVCIVDLIFFYEDTKIKNFMYYTLPLPNIEERGSKKLLFANFVLFVFFSPLFWFQWIAGVSMISLWGATCHNELIFTRDRFNFKMDKLNKSFGKKYETFPKWNRAYKKILVDDIRSFNRITKVINHFKGFVELFCSISIPVDFLVQVAQLYVTISMDMPFSVRLKGISFFVVSSWPMFLMYWTGQILENGVAAVSFSIYCSPWYWSAKVRKDVHIFLNQTRRTKNLFMIKVYPLLLSNFARFAHTILSCVNILQFVKIVRQMRGTQNIFGYRSTTANQLYLLYCICGKIYFTKKIHPFIKCLWFVINFCGVLVSYTTGLVCLLYDSRLDVGKLLDIATAIGVSTDISIVFPSIVYYYRNQIENMISEIDKIHKNKSTIRKKRIRVKSRIFSNFCTMSALMFVHSFACIFDVILFYEDEKVKNFKYYPFPLANVEKNGSGAFFTTHSFLLVFASPLYWFQWISAVNMISLWGAKCHNELMYVRDKLNFGMDTLNPDLQNQYRQTSRRWDRAFSQILIREMKTVKKITRVIDHFRGIVQVFCSLAIPVNFLVQVVHLYLTISMDLPFSVRLKGIAFFLAAIWPMFLLYWVGEILENAVSAVSFSVYCSPWYYSVKVRKNVQIFLCQTQKSENLFMCKVYPLVLRNYSRLVHSVLSTVNILRRVTLKFNQSRNNE